MPGIILFLVAKESLAVITYWDTMADNTQRWTVTNLVQLAKLYKEKWLLDTIYNRSMLLYYNIFLC